MCTSLAISAESRETVSDQDEGHHRKLLEGFSDEQDVRLQGRTQEHDGGDSESPGRHDADHTARGKESPDHARLATQRVVGPQRMGHQPTEYHDRAFEADRQRRPTGQIRITVEQRALVGVNGADEPDPQDAD
jgi:hypothetical protein